MKLTITVDIPDDQLRELLRRAGRPEPDRNGRAEHDEPPDVQAEPPRPRAMDGREFLEWILRQPGAGPLKTQATIQGKKLGYGWKIQTWSPAQVHEVREHLDKLPAPWGGIGPT